MKLLEVELTSITAEGERVRVRFTNPKNRQQICDVLMDDPPALAVRKLYVLHIEPVETKPASG
jgi:hypothetical protein